MNIIVGQVVQMKKVENDIIRHFDAIVLEFRRDPIKVGYVFTYANLQNLKLHTLLLDQNYKSEIKSGKILYEIEKVSSMKSFPIDQSICGGFVEGDTYLLHTITYNKNKIEFNEDPIICTDSLNYEFSYKYKVGALSFHEGIHYCLVGRGEYGINVYYLSK